MTKRQNHYQAVQPLGFPSMGGECLWKILAWWLATRQLPVESLLPHSSQPHRSIGCLDCVAKYLFPNFRPNAFHSHSDWILWLSRGFAGLLVSYLLNSLRLMWLLDRPHFPLTMIFSAFLWVSFCVHEPGHLTDFCVASVIFYCCVPVCYPSGSSMESIHWMCNYYCYYWLMAKLVGARDRDVAMTISIDYQLGCFRLLYATHSVADTVALVALL